MKIARYKSPANIHLLFRQTKLVHHDTIYDVWLIYYKAENRWALAYRIRWRAVSYGPACLRISWKISSKSHKPEANLTHFLKFFHTYVSFYAAETVYYIEGHGTQEQ